MQSFVLLHNRIYFNLFILFVYICLYFATLYKLIIICKIKYFKTAKNKTFRTFHKKIQKSTKKVQKLHHKGKISVSNFVFWCLINEFGYLFQGMEELIYNTAKGLIVRLMKALDLINYMALKVNIQRIPRQILHSFRDLPIWPNFKG